MSNEIVKKLRATAERLGADNIERLNIFEELVQSWIEGRQLWTMARYPLRSVEQLAAQAQAELDGGEIAPVCFCKAYDAAHVHLPKTSR